MKLYCATTSEIDDPALASQQILDQLDLSAHQLAHSFGLIAMFGAFYDTGVYQAVAKALPFPSASYSTSFQGANGEAGDILLSVVMLTSDDNTFSAFKLDHIDTLSEKGELTPALERLTRDMFAEGRPSLIMPYWGMCQSVSNDDLVTSMDQAFDHVPLFGSVILTSDSQHAGFNCLYQEGTPIEKHESSLILVAIYGELPMNFMVVSGIRESLKLTSTAKVTKSTSNTLHMINNITTVDFLHKMGFMEDSMNLDTMWVLHALVENKETGTSKVRALLGISEEYPGSLYATGNIEEGSMVTFSQLDADATNASTFQAYEQLVEEGAQCFLGISCVARSWANGADYLKEFINTGRLSKRMKREKGKTMNYQIINSGGEVCPIRDKDGNLVNTLHNYALAICYCL